MIHQIVHCRLTHGLDEERVEWIMRQTRIRLLKIPEVRAMGCGKQIDPNSPWRFFFSADYESSEKMTSAQGEATYKAFIDEVIAPNLMEHLVLSYEIEPGKDVRYS